MKKKITRVRYAYRGSHESEECLAKSADKRIEIR
jgi:hypothetical protein